MSIVLPCPSCRTSLTFSDTLLGRTVKCKECGSPVEVNPPVAKAKPVVKKVRAVEPVEDDDEPIRPRKKTATKRDDDDDRPSRKLAKKTSSRRDDDEDDDEDAPKKSMLLPIAIVGGVLVLIVGGVVAAMTMGGGKEKEVVVAPVGKVPDTKPKTVAPPPPNTAPSTTTTEPVSNPPKTTVEPPPVKKVEPVAPPVKTPPMTTKRPTRENPDQDTMDRLMKASVYLEVEDDKGGGGSGSGWFGLEPNLIFTNAHVLGMKSPNSKAPTKITAYVNSGDKARLLSIPSAKLKILAVDRDMDLAVLEVVNEKSIPEPLPLRPSASLGVLEKIVALGFPGGRRLAKSSRSTDPPGVSVSQTTVQALRNDENGNLYSVQVQGGIVHGNSGGPLCDADGNVIGVAVRVDLDNEGRFTNIAYGVPTEYVSGLLAGRIAHVEYGQAYNKDGKVAIPVTVRCLDPRKRLMEVGLACWVGDKENEPRRPGPSHSSKPADSGLQEMKLLYNPAKQEATGELVFPPSSGDRAYWCQPYYVNAITPKYYMGGNSIKLKGTPVDLVPADLTAKYKPGTRRTLTLDYTRNITEFEEGEERDRSERRLRNTTFTLNEQVLKAADAQSVAGLQYGFKSWEFKVIEGDDSVEIPKELRGPLEAELQNTTLTAKINKLGKLTQTGFRPNGAQLNPMIPQEVLIGLGTMAFDVLSKGSIPLPGKTMTAGESWADSAEISIKVRSEGKPAPKGPKGPNPMTPATPGFKEYKAREEVKYTYLGLRDHGGKKEIVVQIEGTVQPAKGSLPNSASGSVKGFARIDEATGVITESEIKHEFEIDSSEKGVKKRISGIEDFKLSRSPAGG